MPAKTEAARPAELRRLASPRARLAAEAILEEWTKRRDQVPLDRIVHFELRSRRQLNSAERRWVADGVFGAVRYWRRDALILEHLGADPGPRARIELWASDEHLPTSLHPSDRPILPGPERPREFLRQTLSYPDAMADALEAALGPGAIDAGGAFNLQAPTILRTNTLRTTRDRVIERNPGARPTRFSPWGVELAGRANLPAVPGFREGWFELQEEASQLVALLTGAQPGQTVMDVGAGSGGKSLALAAMMQNTGAVVALDTSAERLAQLQIRAERSGARIIRAVLLDADEEGRWQLSGAAQRRLSRLRLKADCVLVDAPCSGSGVIRRSPDVKWRTHDLSRFARLQSLLLAQSAEFVAVGGTLTYATCAFEQTQNEEVAERFLASAAGTAFRTVPAVARLEQAIERFPVGDDGRAADHECAQRFESMRSGRFLRTWPHLHNLDAFFAACFVRMGS